MVKKTNLDREISGYYQPAFKQEPKRKFKKLPKSDSKQEFEEKVVPILKDIKNNPEAKQIAQESDIYVGSNSFHNFLIISLVLLASACLVFVMWGIYSDKFKSDIEMNQNNSMVVNPLFNATVNSETTNQFTHTINNPLNSTCICNPTIIVEGCSA